MEGLKSFSNIVLKSKEEYEKKFTGVYFDTLNNSMVATNKVTIAILPATIP